MESWERDYHVSRISTGLSRVKIGPRTFAMRPLDREERFRANEIFRATLEEAIQHGVLKEDDTFRLLRKRRLWSDKDEEEQGKLIKAVDDFKVGLFEHWSQSNARASIRKLLAKARAELQRLDGIKHGLHHITDQGLALAAKLRYSVGTSLLLPDGSPYWRDEDGWNQHDMLIDLIVDQYLKHRLGEAEMREIARNEPWHSTWAAREACGRGIWDVASVDLTDEQRTLVLWSGLYDSVRGHPEAPGEAVFDDDDMLDGWLIIQRRKRDASLRQSRMDGVKNQRIKDADEVYFMANTIEDAREVDGMNDQIAQNTKAMRLAHLKKEGKVPEIRMPDTWQRMNMEYAKLESQRLKGK